MIKESIYKLIHKDIDKKITKNLSFMTENYDEGSLLYILSNNGFSINENIILKYYNGHGFICNDINQLTHGKSPMCQNIERFLNRTI